ncbi:MAG: PHB depolymerase family esterase, partial [Candidatus Binatia bacterium]
RLGAAATVPALPSFGCTSSLSPYPAGASSTDGIELDELERTFRVHVPTSYKPGVPAPVVFLLHGESGSGAQVEAASRMLDVAAAEGFVVVSPDGVEGRGSARTWNAGGAAAAGVDDVLFLTAALDMLEMTTCIDLRRVYATGVAGGARMAHRLGCEAADRFRAVAGTDVTDECTPARPVPELAIQSQGYSASRAAWDFFAQHPRK